jgi:nitrate/TMAO reductase-like tetraheme cytochrome c subunit
MKFGIGRRTMMGGMVTLLVLGIAGLVVMVGGIAAWEYSNSNAFCTNMCHAVHPEEPVAHAASSHARVNCVECHMGRVSTLELMLIKPTHIHELWGMIAGYERPLAAKTMRPARYACEACHWPAVKHSDSVRTKVRYEDDPKSRETRTTLVMHTGFGEARASGSKGIH